MEKSRAQRGEHKSIEPGRLPEANFHLGRMHVDIDHVRGHVERKEHDRLPPGEEQATVSFLHGMQDRAVAKRPAGHEEIL